MLVVKTTSPATSPSPAKLQPSKVAPSSRTSVALLRTYSKLRSRSIVYWLAANYSTYDPALQRAPEIRGVAGAAGECAPSYLPLLREIDEREIGRRPDCQAPPATDPPARGAAHRFDEACQRKPAAHYQIGV